LRRFNPLKPHPQSSAIKFWKWKTFTSTAGNSILKMLWKKRLGEGD